MEPPVFWIDLRTQFSAISESAGDLHAIHDSTPALQHAAHHGECAAAAAKHGNEQTAYLFAQSAAHYALAARDGRYSSGRFVVAGGRHDQRQLRVLEAHFRTLAIDGAKGADAIDDGGTDDEAVDAWLCLLLDGPYHGSGIIRELFAASSDLCRELETKARHPAPCSLLCNKQSRKDLAWPDIQIRFTNDQQLQVIVKGAALPPENYAEFGFEDRTQNPTLAWHALRLLAESRGALTEAATPQEWTKIEKRIQEIRKILRRRFSIESDPIPYSGDGYRARFLIECSRSYSG